jgi:cytoskeleton protein RodZ
MTEKTIGEQLCSAREKMHLSINEVAESLHIRSSYLKSIEEDKLDELPSQTQARGFIRLYASQVGLDPQELLKEKEVVQTPSHVEAVPSAAEDVEPLNESSLRGAKKKKFPKTTAPELPPTPVPTLPKNDQYQKIMKKIGDDLVARRKNLALSLDEVEDHTHIRKAYLDAIENGKIDELPSTIQGRGLLANYAEFLDLDADPILVRFAEALQNKLKPFQEWTPEPNQAEPAELKTQNPVWMLVKKYLTLDMVVGGALILTLFFFVFWGAAQLINSNAQQISTSPSERSSGTLTSPAANGTLSNQAPTLAALIPLPSLLTTESISTGTLPTPAASQSIFGSGSLQVHVVASQSAFVRVTADGRQIFNDRVISGNAYQFSGSTSIELITGNAAALEVTFNGAYLGTLGNMGQVVDLIFNSVGVQTATPKFTISPTSTPTNTATPTKSPTPKSVPPTLTPLVPPTSTP